jgi:hypothetical protein
MQSIAWGINFLGNKVVDKAGLPWFKRHPGIFQLPNL